MKLDLPVMLAALVAAAALQELLPAPPIGLPQLKVQLLPAVALYYGRRRQWPLALCAALWAGILTDAMGGLPRGTTSGALLLASGLVLLFRDAGRNSSPLDAVSPSLAVYLFIAAVQPVRLAFSGAGADIPVWQAFLSGVKLLPLSVLAAVLADMALGRVDFAAGNVEPEKEAAIG